MPGTYNIANHIFQRKSVKNRSSEYLATKHHFLKKPKEEKTKQKTQRADVVVQSVKYHHVRQEHPTRCIKLRHYLRRQQRMAHVSELLPPTRETSMAFLVLVSA